MLAFGFGICKICPFGKEIYFSLQMAKKQLSSLVSFRQESVSNVAQVIAAKR
jgi:hypothetical protein